MHERIQKLWMQGNPRRWEKRIMFESVGVPFMEARIWFCHKKGR